MTDIEFRNWRVKKLPYISDVDDIDLLKMAWDASREQVADELKRLREENKYFNEHHGITEKYLGLIKLMLQQNKYDHAIQDLEKCSNEIDEIVRIYQPMTAKLMGIDKEPKRIDWSRMPRCRVEFEGQQGFSEYHPARGFIGVWKSVKADNTLHDLMCGCVVGQDIVKLLPDLDWRPWLGDECPVPEGVECEIMRRDGGIIKRDFPADTQRDWNHINNHPSDIIYYKITGGLADGFTT